ncbi:type IVB secretion system protein IcmH/DotU [Janthinobacterium fluminis]|uniref:Type IVB secretion system protein IcmH/DotU n=1 Tax=Janthinobacterium fluminis TaxID=2987524 RepID=A0ABT5JTC4_9BURK|nr:type IVB secretion system protein IcmH/DotU [Janthinobacterium fluminis]MDC8756001.1 type IVB secretion system protein IcmH/DotU [Janthinobacterium fluminis]
MTNRVERRAAPSLLGPRGAAPAATRGGSLLDLMHEGFYLLFMLKNGASPPLGDDAFMQKISPFLAEFDREAKKLRAESEDIEAAKYAFCAALDEVILSSTFPVRGEWERRPLQLLLFGDQLAGEHFFDRLEELRGKGGARLQALQVFHMCLLLGFQGKYAIHGGEKLNYLSARLGDEIAHIKGKSRGFAPRGERPDQVIHKYRGGLPLWALSSLFALIAVCAYWGLKSSLTQDTVNAMAAYANLVQLAPRPAHLTITLP